MEITPVKNRKAAEALFEDRFERPFEFDFRSSIQFRHGYETVIVAFENVHSLPEAATILTFVVSAEGNRPQTLLLVAPYFAIDATDVRSAVREYLDEQQLEEHLKQNRGQ